MSKTICTASDKECPLNCARKLKNSKILLENREFWTVGNYSKSVVSGKCPLYIPMEEK